MKSTSATVTDTFIKPTNLFTRGDPLTLLVRRHLKLPALPVAIFTVLLLNIPVVIASFTNGVLFSTPLRIGLLNDYHWCFSQLTSVPATLFYFLWLPEGIIGVINGLRHNKVLSVKEEDELERFLIEFDRDYSHQCWALISFIIVGFFMAFFSIPEQRRFVTWQTSGPFLFWYTISFWAFSFFLALLGTIRVIIAILWFNRLFRKFTIDVRVLHPDGAGGLSPLSEFSVRIGYIIGIYGAVAVVAVLAESYKMTSRFTGPMLSNALIISLLLYIVLAPIVFFAPIGAARSAMKAAKDDFILQIADQFEIETIRLRSLLASNSDELKRSLEKIEQLQKIYGMASKFPIWPFNVDNVIRFLSAVSSPFVLGLVSLIIDLIR